MQAVVDLHEICLLFCAICADASPNVRNTAYIRPFCCAHILDAARPLLLVGSELSPHFHFTPHDCFAWGVYQGVAAGVVVVVVDSILILRGKFIYFSGITRLILASARVISW